MDFEKALLKWPAGLGLYGTVQNRLVQGTIGVDDTVSCGSNSRIYPQYTHHQVALRGLFKLGVINIEIGPDILDILVLFQCFHQLDHCLRAFPFQFDIILGHH
jgi:hypothetical protein